MTRLLSRIPRPAARPPSPFGPDAIEVGPRAVRIGDGWCASFAIVGYPREVGHGWLEPLTAHPSRLDVALHIEPVPANIAADRLRRQLARLESGRRADAAKGRLGDPDVEVAAEDARELAAGLARGEQKLFRVGLYLTVHARSEKALGAECARVRAVCNSMLLDAQPSTWRTLQGWTSTLPVGVDALGQRRSFDTDALAASFPFASAELSASSGVLYGTATNGSGLVLWDRFAQDNHNSVILARSGAGKSYLAKLEALRSLYQGIEVAVVDPEDEYRRLAETVGGAYVHFGAPGVRVNPFDLAPGTRRAHPTGAVRPHPHRRPARRQTRPGLDRGARPGDRRRLRIGRDHRRPPQPQPTGTPAPRPCCRPGVRRRLRRSDPGLPAGAVHHRHPPGTVRRADHHPSRRPPHRLQPARPAGRAESGGDGAHPRRHLAASV